LKRDLESLETTTVLQVVRNFNVLPLRTLSQSQINPITSIYHRGRRKVEGEAGVVPDQVYTFFIDGGFKILDKTD
jgi:hypothetical protein